MILLSHGWTLTALVGISLHEFLVSLKNKWRAKHPKKRPSGLFLTHKYQQLFFRIMEGKAAKSASGAAMSKYDVEVEARLKALEAKIAALESAPAPEAPAAPAAPAASGDVDVLWKIVKMMEPNFDALVKKFGG